MPRQSRSQEIGRMGERWFPNQLPPNWIFQHPSSDVGVDGVVVICDESPANGLEFRVQIKASTRWCENNGLFEVKNIKKDSLLYWLSGFSPTLLVLYDVERDMGFCSWVNQIVGKDVSILKTIDKMLSLYLSKDDQIIPGIWERIAKQVYSLNLNICNQVSFSGNAFPILKAIKNLTECLEILDMAYHGKTNNDESFRQKELEFCINAEVQSYKIVANSLIELNKGLKDSMSSIIGIRGTAYFIAENLALKMIPENFEIMFSRKRRDLLCHRRQQ